MARQVDSESNEICDIHLLYNEEDKQQYMCGQCHNLAINTKALICTNNHEPDVTFYCGSCAASIQSNNQCPINQHQNPRFADENTAQARIRRDLEFICPYSAQFNRFDLPIHANNHHTIITMEGKQQQDEGSGCHWQGTYTELQHHLIECRFKSYESKVLFDLRNKVQALESDNTGLNSKIRAMERTISTMTTTIQELSQLRQTVDVMNRDERKVLMPPQPVQPQSMNTTSADPLLIWILGAVVAVMFAILAVNIHTNYSAIARLKVDCIEMNRTMASICHDCNIKSSPRNYSMTDHGFDDHDVLSKKQQSKEVNWNVKWIMISVFKCIGQLSCLVFLFCAFDAEETDTWPGCFIIWVGIHLIIDSYVFYPADKWMIDVLWVALLGACSWMAHRVYRRTRGPRFVLGLVFVEFNILYWILLHNDDAVLLVIAFFITLGMICAWLTDPPLCAAYGSGTYNLGIFIMAIAILTDVIVVLHKSQTVE
eukprot:184927_1